MSFIKIDVEGYEPNVLRGMRQTFKDRRCKAALIEFCPGNLYRVGSSPEELFDAVEACGMRMHFLKKDGALGPVVNSDNAAGVVLTNVALVPDDFYA